MPDRMQNAMALADKCWLSVSASHPGFVEAYLKVAETLLMEKVEVSGDAFKKACLKAGVKLPLGKHPNVWVSGPRFLEQLGWVTKIRKVVPTEKHNHMPEVTLWKSNLYLTF